MKRRMGFVSNSSTASFVLLGFDATELGLDDVDDNAIYGDACPSGVALVIGKFIYYCSSDSYAESEVLDLGEILKEVVALRKKHGSTKPIKLWTGMMGC